MKFLLYLFLFISSNSIAQKLPLSYYVEPAKPKEDRLIGVVLDIEVFEDVRKANEEPLFFEKGRSPKYKGRDVCINSEKFYTKPAVNIQATEMLAKHLNSLNVYDSVIAGNLSKATYYLKGKLSKLWILQEYPDEELSGVSVFGAIGSNGTVGILMPATASIEIQELKLYNSKNELVKDFGNLSRYYDFKWEVDPQCVCAHNAMNQKLKIFNTELSGMIEAAIRENSAQ